MASYCFLQQQALQGDGCTAQAQQVGPVAAPFPSLDAAAAFSLELKKNGSAPAFGTLLVSSSKGRILVKEEAEDPLGLVFSSGHFRVFPAFTQQAASVRITTMRTQKTIYSPTEPQWRISTSPAGSGPKALRGGPGI